MAAPTVLYPSVPRANQNILCRRHIFLSEPWQENSWGLHAEAYGGLDACHLLFAIPHSKARERIRPISSFSSGQEVVDLRVLSVLSGLTNISNRVYRQPLGKAMKICWKLQGADIILKMDLETIGPKTPTHDSGDPDTNDTRDITMAMRLAIPFRGQRRKNRQRPTALSPPASQSSISFPYIDKIQIRSVMSRLPTLEDLAKRYGRHMHHYAYIVYIN
jgi:hypothetical protein